MARIDGFGYLPGNSPLHRLDPRTKLFALALLGIAAALLGLPGITAAILLFFPYLLSIGIPLNRLPASTGVLFLLAATLLARTFSSAGPPLFRLGPFVATTIGLMDGLLICLRLWVILSLGAVLTLTTRSSEVRAAVRWILRPIPFLPQGRVSVMLALVLRFIPLVLRQARLTKEAGRARCVENRKNPVFRLRVFMVPFLRAVFLQADRMALAMEARGFSENRSEPELKMALRDRRAFIWIVFSAVMLFAVDRLLAGSFLSG